MADAFFRIPASHGGPCFRAAASIAVTAACCVCVTQLYLLLSYTLVQYITGAIHSAAEMQAVFAVGNATCRVLYLALAALNTRRFITARAACHAACHVATAWWPATQTVALVWGALALTEVAAGAVAAARHTRHSATRLRKALALYATLGAVLGVTYAALGARAARAVLPEYPLVMASGVAHTMAHLVLVLAALGQFLAPQ
uniref:Uncharacterized protein n=1 Tax=viral metagenome TaxID=1070528 RepID=A0A6C0AUT1_9ZZZZ